MDNVQDEDLGREGNSSIMELLFGMTLGSLGSLRVLYLIDAINAKTIWRTLLI